MPKPEINVTPLIDVLLVLLIIFMVISPLKPARFEAKIPQPPDSTLQLSANPSMIVVEIKTDATIIMNGEVKYTSPARLTDLTRDIEQKINEPSGVSESDKRVFLKAPKSLSYGKVIDVIDAIEMAGIIPLSLQIDDLET